MQARTMLHSLSLLALAAVAGTARVVAAQVVLLARPLAPSWRVPFTQLLLALAVRAAVLLAMG